MPRIPGINSTSAYESSVPQFGRHSGPVALLLPLSGPFAPVGRSMEQAAKLAFAASGAPPLDVRNTQGTPEGAAAAAQAAINAGDGLILGPLTASAAEAVGPIAHAADVNVLAFSNDEDIAKPGLWPLGISPGQQVRRVIAAAAASGHTRTAAILPSSPFGQLMGTALQKEAKRLGETAPQIGFYDPSSFSSLTRTVRATTNFDARGAGLEARIRAARDQDDEAGRLLAAKLALEPIPPPPFDTLLLAAHGETLAEIATLLPYYDVDPPQVQIVGPMLWAREAQAMATHQALVGALYAAPPPALRSAFVQKFESVYGTKPPAIDDLAFDAAAIAVLAAHEGGYTMRVLTNPTGFFGTDGVLVLQPNGKVRRGLAVFRVKPGGPQLVAPAPHELPPDIVPAR